MSSTLALHKVVLRVSSLYQHFLCKNGQKCIPPNIYGYLVGYLCFLIRRSLRRPPIFFARTVRCGTQLASAANAFADCCLFRAVWYRRPPTSKLKKGVPHNKISPAKRRFLMWNTLKQWCEFFLSPTLFVQKWAKIYPTKYLWIFGGIFMFSYRDAALAKPPAFLYFSY